MNDENRNNRMEDQGDEDEESVNATWLQHKWSARFKAVAKDKKKEAETPELRQSLKL